MHLNWCKLPDIAGRWHLALPVVDDCKRNVCADGGSAGLKETVSQPHLQFTGGTKLNEQNSRTQQRSGGYEVSLARTGVPKPRRFCADWGG
jgi:hypothetical protein